MGSDILVLVYSHTADDACNQLRISLAVLTGEGLKSLPLTAGWLHNFQFVRYHSSSVLQHNTFTALLPKCDGGVL